MKCHERYWVLLRTNSLHTSAPSSFKLDRSEFSPEFSCAEASNAGLFPRRMLPRLFRSQSHPFRGSTDARLGSVWLSCKWIWVDVIAISKLLSRLVGSRRSPEAGARFH